MQTTTITGSATITITIVPLTTIFTPPPDCSTSWTFAPTSSDSVVNGILLQNALSVVNSCYPPGFSNTGRAMATHVFSPGYCPMGYTSAEITVNGPTTTAICCPSNHNYYKTTITDSFPPPLLAGCLSSMPSAITTKVPVAAPGNGKETLVSGPLTMWAQPITVMLQSTDLSLYGDVSTSSTATPTPAVSATQPTLTYYDYNPTAPTALASNPPPTAATTTGTLMTPTISTAAIEPTNPTDLRGPDANETTALSSSAKAGIGIGAAALGLAVFLIAIASRVFRRRRKRRQREPAPQAAPRRPGSSRSFKPWAKVKEVRRGPPAELEA
ncbi:hypothetical protein ANOM_008958 [Aspergillus nomiae NRRL 13137]|uniref:Uncharacterized protein n=1 Tax=Aspergillus nomiae NRRL (strain ATCC 15546 / NRRL 13137 / CBS 260.88 / M93) TaxID=1509407 RepID=A0A0L1ITT5_ASPN3|nr:uncharacterized protein ANOM_008958 [Aspergillus nomiae NRRL 13137]KNG82966.1 hypothetical protein ANOM_008958 [Aspergillus nomiae NRRL 13137]